jgi:putative transposase
MTISKHSDSQIMSILKQASSGMPVASILREYKISSATFYGSVARWGGMGYNVTKIR